MKKNDAFRRAAALMAALSITVSLAAPAFAGTYYIDDGDITITKNADGSQKIEQSGSTYTDDAGEETIITTHDQTITTQESDLEGPAAEDSGFGPVGEDNYQPAQPEDADQPESADRQESAEEPKDADQPESAEEPEGADQQESAEEPEDADQQPQPQQAAPAPAAAPAAPTSVITLINNFANTVLNLTLKDVKIDVSDTGTLSGDMGRAAMSVQGTGDVEIELDGNNELKSGYYRAGLEKTSQATGMLTLKDDNKGDDNKEAGSLTATGGFRGAGIGGQGKNEERWPERPPETPELYDASNITITGGTVNATGNSFGAGIGGGNCGSGKNITITDGTVNADGGYWAAGIGGGYGGNGEDITITGGTVNADGGGGGYGAGIGGGYNSSGKNITITSGTVNATGGSNGGAGIGGGAYGGGTIITINGGTVTATGGGRDEDTDTGGAAGIGGGAYRNGEYITINDGTVTATGGEQAAGIGGGAGGYEGDYGGKNITINGGTVTATGGGYGAGIGGGERGNGENITINGGRVNATGGSFGAGIGGGGLWKGNGEVITINGGTVNAAGGSCGAGIGGGATGSGSNVTVSGAAQVTAKAGKSDGRYGAGATIGNGGNWTRYGEPVDGEEIQADISGVTTGYIHHILYEQDGTTIKREWWEPVRPDGESLDLLHVETLEGDPLPFNAQQQGSTLRVTTDNLVARLHGTRQALEALREQGVEQIEFVTTLKTTTLSVEDLLAEGGSWFALEHDGLVSRQLSAAQAESLKCWMH